MPGRHLRSALLFESTRPMEFWSGISGGLRGYVILFGRGVPFGPDLTPILTSGRVALWMWGAGFAVLGVAQFLGMSLDLRWLRVSAASGVFSLALAIAVTAVRVDPWAITTSLFIVLALSQAFLAIRCILDGLRVLDLIELRGHG